MSPTPYLRFEGQCSAALQFYAEVLGGQVTMMHLYSNAPPGTGMPPAPEGWVMHGRVVWPGGGMLMGSDGGMGPYTGVHGITLSAQGETVADGQRIFDALAQGGQVQMAFAPTFWALGFGALVDRFGVPWMVNVEAPMPA